MSLVEEILGTHQFHLFIYRTRKSATVFVAQSRQPDSVVDSIYRELKRAASQFTANGPSMLWAYVDGIEPMQWKELIKKQRF